MNLKEQVIFGNYNNLVIAITITLNMKVTVRKIETYHLMNILMKLSLT